MYRFSEKVCFSMFLVLVKLVFEDYIRLWSICVSWAFWQKINFLISMNLLVVIICCSRGCLLNENMKFSNLCCLFANLAVTLESVAITFANSSCCVCNSVTCFSLDLTVTWIDFSSLKFCRLTYHYMFSFELGLRYFLMYLLGQS